MESYKRLRYSAAAATIETLGVVKQADRVNDLSVSAELADVITAFNSLLSKLIAAGIMGQKPY